MEFSFSIYDHNEVSNEIKNAVLTTRKFIYIIQAYRKKAMNRRVIVMIDNKRVLMVEMDNHSNDE